MKITDVKVWLVEGVKYNWTLLKIYTDEGLTGVGEATNWPGSQIVEAAVKDAGQRIIGLNPLRTDFIWTKLYRDLNWVGPFGASMCAISGIDMALLDLKAKALNIPMAETYNVLIAPHNPNGPLSTIASAHVCASIPNFFRQEFIFNDVPWRDEIISSSIKIKDGQFILSEKAGLGVDLVEKEMEKHPGIRRIREGYYI